MKVEEVVEQLRRALPPVFLGVASGQLTGGAIHWPTVQNKRAQRQIPDECFCRSGPRVLVIRDPFLDWWATTLTEARQPDTRRPPRRQDQAASGSKRRSGCNEISAGRQPKSRTDSGSYQHTAKGGQQ